MQAFDRGADDYVTVPCSFAEVVARIGAVLNGSAPDLSRYHIELRGLGILNIKDLFGVAAVRDNKKLELVVETARQMWG